MAAGLAALLLSPPGAAAQSVTRDVRLIVPYAPGGSVDILGRLLAEVLPAAIGHNVVVENRSGAGAYIGLQAVANAPADGHTIGLAPDLGLAVTPVIPGTTLPINPDRDLAPIMSLIRVPTVLVARSDAAFRDLDSLLSRARTSPTAVTAGISGNGTIPHLLIARLNGLAGTRMVYVPYRGGTPALLDVLAGNVDLYFSLLPESLGYIQGGQMRPLVFASPTRNAGFPDVPALTERWPGFTGTADYGLVGTAGLSPAWIAYWNRVVNAALARPEVRARIAQMSSEATGGTAEDYRAKLANDRAVWGEVVRANNIRAGD
jgi:tripartite-type tricarboxylate transporter receptor subunit TctC